MKCWIWLGPIIALGFLILSLAVQKDYGWNWDLFQTAARGQSYFHFFTTGKTNNDDVKSYQGRLSFYEKTQFDFTWAARMTIGHPPANDILLALSNQVFYKRLGILGDMEAYHLNGVVLTALALLCVFLWSYEVSGLSGALISVVAYGGFPLLFAEQHFNFKDPAVAAYNIIFLYLFWLGLIKKRSIYIILSAIVGGISLGTKFNILLLFPVIGIWLLWNVKEKIRLSLIVVPVVAFLVFYATYPALWADPLHNVMSVVRYYRDIGGNRCPYVPATGLWFIRCTDWQTLRLFVITIPLPTIALGFVGGIVAVANIGKGNVLPWLWFLYTTSVVLRTVLPVSNLYGGSLRQVMEIIGPLALLAGVGADWIYRRYRKSGVVLLCLLVLYVPVISHMISLHPNENLYTNVFADIFWKKEKQQFINGTVSYGNAYRQAADWINKNAQSNAKVSLTNIASAVPGYVFRPDIQYGVYWSGYQMKGEYLVELVDAGSPHAQLFPYKYEMRVLQPLYEEAVAGNPLVRVFKNDQAHVRAEFQEAVPLVFKTDVSAGDEVVLRLNRLSRLQSLQIITNSPSCLNQMTNAYVLLSENGKDYTRMYETVQELNSSDSAILEYPFAAENAKFIKLFSYLPTGCDLSGVQYTVRGFK